MTFAGIAQTNVTEKGVFSSGMHFSQSKYALQLNLTKMMFFL